MAIAGAGLHVYSEEAVPARLRSAWDNTDQVTLTLTGFDVEIRVDSIIEEVNPLRVVAA